MIDVLVPEEQEGTKAVVRAWLKQVGDRVEENDPLVELETDKVAMEVPAPAAGVLREILLHSDDDAVPGAVLGRIAPAVEIGDVEAEPVSRRRPSAARHRRRTPGSAERRRIARPGCRPRSSAPSSSTTSTPAGSRAPAAAGASPAPTSTARSRRRPGSSGRSKASSRPRPATSAPTSCRTTACGCASPRTCSARSTQAPHVTAVFEADFSAIIAHRDAPQGGLGEEGGEAHLHRLSGRRRRRGDEGRAGDQQPLARRPARALRRHQYRRRHRARHQGADRAGAAPGPEAVAEGHRRRPRRSDREGARARS